MRLAHPHRWSRVTDADYLYVSSYVSPGASFPDCQPPHDLISIVKVPQADPTAAQVVATPVLFPDGGNPGARTDYLHDGCHDITAFPSRKIAAGACMGDGVIMDISDPAAPAGHRQVRDTENFAFWHSATFNSDGTKVVFTDELGGGGAATCNAADRRRPRRQRDLRPVRRQPADLQVVLQDPAPPERHRELRRPQRLDHPGRRS